MDVPRREPANRGWRKYRSQIALGLAVTAVVFGVAALVPLGLYIMSQRGNEDSPGAGATAAIEDQVAELAGRFTGEIGIAARNIVTGEEITRNADARFPTASTIKTAVMLEAYHRRAAGDLRFDETIVLREEDKVGGSGVLNRMHAGLQLTVADLVHLMIVLSDNTATNLTIERLGTVRINERLDAYGLRETRLFRQTFRDGRADVLPELEREFGLGMTTPREMASLMALIAEGKAVDAEASASMLETLRRQQDRAMIPRLLPHDGNVRVGNKSGTDAEKQPAADGVRGQVRADAAIVTGPGVRYVIAIYTRQGRDARPGVENAALVAGARISRAIYDHFTRAGSLRAAGASASSPDRPRTP